MFISHVDTPWHFDGESYGPELARDPVHGPNIRGWTDVTGAEWHEWPIGSGTMVKGGNYADGSPGASQTGKGGQPDYLTIEIKTETLAAVEAIDNDSSDKFMVLWTEEIVEAP